MMLIGQFDSPFVRRVAIALDLYGMAFEHAPWSGFGDVDKIAAVNPLRRVPTLVMDDGVVLTDSGAILEILDDMVGPERALIVRTGPERREALRLMAFASGVADKGVALVYEKAFRDAPLDFWVARCSDQVNGSLALLEAARAGRTTPWLFGERLGHADIVLATMLRFIREALEGSVPLDGYPALNAHAVACEALPVFKARSQTFILTPPKGR
ncbi:MAG: hypothetical protein JWP35_4571 [Caulobacter sp.]|nr:hypothetical protein [Caulobacter sp.]